MWPGPLDGLLVAGGRSGGGGWEVAFRAPEDLGSAVQLSPPLLVAPAGPIPFLKPACQAAMVTIAVLPLVHPLARVRLCAVAVLTVTSQGNSHSCSHFLDEETEVQRGEVTGTRSFSWEVVELGFEPT